MPKIIEIPTHEDMIVRFSSLGIYPLATVQRVAVAETLHRYLWVKGGSRVALNPISGEAYKGKFDPWNAAYDINGTHLRIKSERSKYDGRWDLTIDVNGEQSAGMGIEVSDLLRECEPDIMGNLGACGIEFVHSKKPYETCVQNAWDRVTQDGKISFFPKNKP